MPETINIPGTKTKIPIWFGILLGALVLVIVAMKGSPKKEEEEDTAIPQYGVDLLAAELNQRMREMQDNFLAMIEYYLKFKQGITPPSEPITPPPNQTPRTPPDICQGDPNCEKGYIIPKPKILPVFPNPPMPPYPYPSPGPVPGSTVGGSDPFLNALDLAEIFSPVTVARSLYETLTDRPPGESNPNRKPMYNIGDTFLYKGGPPKVKRIVNKRPNDEI